MALMVFLVLGLSGTLLADDAATGKQIFREQCVICHGEDGQGVKGIHEEPLGGEHSLAELTKLINDTMPKAMPEAVVGKDAALVAKYVHEKFYGDAAPAGSAKQAAGPRVELSRLTVRQYENVLADLIGSFRPQRNAGRYWQTYLASLRRDESAPVEAHRPRTKKDRKDEHLPPHGLHGSYYKSRVVGFRDRVFDRIDPNVAFDFGEGNPDPRLPKNEFAMAWDGSLVAPATGDYTFIVDTSNGARLFVNDLDEPLIDAMVKSGKETRHKATIRLLGGRTYSLRLEYHRSKRAKTARVSLSWKRPHHPVQIIPERLLVPYRSPEVYVVNTPFPPDDRSTGFVRGTSISKDWSRAATFAALEATAYISERVNDLADTSPNDKNRTKKLKAFCRAFAQRAFRRPLNEKLAKVFVGEQFAQAPDSGTAVKRSILLILTSPRFLYRERITPGHDGYDIASRLSFGLWDSLPDEELLAAAATGKLSDPAERRRQARRMFDDPRTHSKLRQFLHLWLDLDRMHGLEKNDKQFPKFTEQIRSDLRTSLNLFLDDVVWSRSSDFRDLMLKDRQYLSARLADYYGLDVSIDDGFHQIEFQPKERAGALTHPYVMAGFAYSDASSPIHRGVFLVRSVLGRTLLPPPDAFTPLDPDLHPGLTTRQRVTMQTGSQKCMVCHSLINPLGFSLANFDAVGRYRERENNKSIDAAAVYTTKEGEAIPLTGAAGLGAFLARSPLTHRAFTEQVFRHVAKQPIQAFGPGELKRLTEDFRRHDFSIKHLVIESALVAAMPAGSKDEARFAHRQSVSRERE